MPVLHRLLPTAYKVENDTVLTLDMQEGPAPCTNHTANECQRQDLNQALADPQACVVHRIMGTAAVLSEEERAQGG